MRIGRKERCALCGGSGHEDREGSGPVEEIYFLDPCSYCAGRGTVLLVWFGFRCVQLGTLAAGKFREQVGL